MSSLPTFQEEPIALLGVASTPVLGALSAGSMSLSSGRSCARSSQSSCLFSGDASLLGGTLKFFCSSYSILYKTILSHRVPGLMNEDLPVGLLGIHSLSVLSMVPNQLMCEMILDMGGRFSPAGIVGVHTLSLLLSSQAAHDRATVEYPRYNILIRVD